MNLTEALGAVPADIAAALQSEFSGLLRRFNRRDWGPAELNGGRLAEAVLRYVEWKDTGSFTPFGKQLGRPAICAHAEQNVQLDDSVRFHIPRAAQLIMDIRNKRDVAHLSAVVDVNEMDAHLVLRVGAWLVAELLRLESTLDPMEVQSLLDSLTVTHAPLVEIFDGARWSWLRNSTPPSEH